MTVADRERAVEPLTSDLSPPFRIRIPEAALRDRRARLAAARLPAALDAEGWDDGVSLSFARRLADH